MQINVTFRHTESTKALREYAEEKIRKVTKFLERPQEANIILSVEKIRHIAEVIISADGLTITGKEATSDLYSAIDKVMDKIERQLIKEKGRRHARKTAKGTRKASSALSVLTELEPFEKLPEKYLDQKFPPIVPSNLYLSKPMTVEDAAVELMSGKAPLVVFLNSSTMRICVLHKNPNGSLGLVETND